MKTKFKNFLNENNEVVDVVRLVAYDLGEEINEFIGGGFYGKAFSTKSGKVIKLTDDDNEVAIAYKLSKNKNWMKCLINHYNVGKITKATGSKITFIPYRYYILMDQVLPLSIDERYSVDNFSQILMSDDYWQQLNDKENLKMSDDDKKIYPYILKLAKEMKLHKIKGVDFHSGNVGWDKNKENLVLFDISYLFHDSYLHRLIQKIKPIII